MSLKKFAEKFIKAEDEAWLKGNVDALDDVEHSDVVYHLTPPMPDVVGREAHKQFIVAARKAFSDIKFEIKYYAYCLSSEYLTVLVARQAISIRSNICGSQNLRLNR